MVFLSFVSGGDARGSSGHRGRRQSGSMLKRWLSIHKPTGSGSKSRTVEPTLIPPNRQSYSATDIYRSSAVPIGASFDAHFVDDVHKQRARRSMPVAACLPIGSEAQVFPEAEHLPLATVPPEQMLPSTRTFQTRKDSLIRRVPSRYTTSPAPLVGGEVAFGVGGGSMGTILQLDGDPQHVSSSSGKSCCVPTSQARTDSRLVPKGAAKPQVPWRKRSLIYAMYHTVQNDEVSPHPAASADAAAIAADDESLAVPNQSYVGTDITAASETFASCESIDMSLYRDVNEDSRYASVSSIPSLGDIGQGKDSVGQYSSTDLPLLSAVNEALQQREWEEEDGRLEIELEAGPLGCRTRANTMASDVCSVGTHLSDCGPGSSMAEALLVGPAYVCSERYAPRLSTIVRADNGQLVIKPSKRSLRDSGSIMSSSDDMVAAAAADIVESASAVSRPPASTSDSLAESCQAQLLGLRAADLGISVPCPDTYSTGDSSRYQQAVLESLVAQALPSVAHPPHQEDITPYANSAKYTDRAASGDCSGDSFRRTDNAVLPKTQSPQQQLCAARMSSSNAAVAQTSGRSPVAASHSPCGGPGSARLVPEWGSGWHFGSVEPSDAKNTAAISMLSPQPEDARHYRHLLVGVPFSPSANAGIDAATQQDHLGSGENSSSSNADSLTTFADDCEERGSVGSSTAVGGSAAAVCKDSSASLQLSQSFSNCSSRGGDLLSQGSPARTYPSHCSDAQLEIASILGGADGGNGALGNCLPQLHAQGEQRPDDRDFVSDMRSQIASAAQGQQQQQQQHQHQRQYARESASGSSSGSGQYCGAQAASRHATHAVPETPPCTVSDEITLPSQSDISNNSVGSGHHDSTRSLSSATRRLKSAFAKGKKLNGLRQLQRKITHQRSMSMSTSSSSSSSLRPPPKVFRFNELVAVYETWDSGDYDRRGMPAVKLDTELIQLIKQELNEFKVYEMAVHEESRGNTHYIY